MQKLFIHIGTHKTATTWLQHYLAKNSDRLNDLGFYYPMSGRVTQAQHRLGQAIFQRRSPTAALDDVPVWQKFRRELSLTRYENIVVSSEEFEWVMRPKLIREYLPDVSIHAVVYLRRQDDYLESLYGQQIRDYHPRLTKTVAEYVAENNLGFLDYDSLIQRWEAASDDVTVRVFDKTLMKGGDIGKDFLAAIGIDSDDGFEHPTAAVIDHKASLSLEALEFVRQCNTLNLNAVTHDQLVAQVIRLDKIAGRSRQRLLSAEARDHLMRRYEAGNRNIAHKHRSASGLADLFPAADNRAPVFQQASSFNAFDLLLKVNSLVKLI